LQVSLYVAFAAVDAVKRHSVCLVSLNSEGQTTQYAFPVLLDPYLFKIFKVQRRIENLCPVLCMSQQVLKLGQQIPAVLWDVVVGVSRYPVFNPTAIFRVILAGSDRGAGFALRSNSKAFCSIPVKLAKRFLFATAGASLRDNTIEQTTPTLV
jgi:hypothetical protein